MSIFIPNKINVGYQNREGTYTGKLAYVIYYDERGKLRKETSWQNWRDENIPNNIYENVPTDGFVLNKKVGGYKSGWDFRQTYARVYDPRGFEFEITMENLLWILECCNSIKGKGLEGEFVYGYSNGDLLLVPVDSPDYKKIEKLSNTLKSGDFVKGSELKVGALYKDKNNQEFIYLGRYNYYKEEVNNKDYYKNQWDYPLDDSWLSDITHYPSTTRYRYINKGKAYWFAQIFDWSNGEKFFYFIHPQSISKRFLPTDIESSNYFQNAYNKMKKQYSFSPKDFSATKIIYIPYDYFEKAYNNHLKEAYFRFSYLDSLGELRNSELYFDDKTQKIYLSYNNNYYDSIKEIYDKFKPCFVKVYLENGNLYKEEGYNYGYEE